jgi:hypothetical protein
VCLCLRAAVHSVAPYIVKAGRCRRTCHFGHVIYMEPVANAQYSEISYLFITCIFTRCAAALTGLSEHEVVALLHLPLHLPGTFLCRSCPCIPNSMCSANCRASKPTAGSSTLLQCLKASSSQLTGQLVDNLLDKVKDTNTMITDHRAPRRHSYSSAARSWKVTKATLDMVKLIATALFDLSPASS